MAPRSSRREQARWSRRRCPHEKGPAAESGGAHKSLIRNLCVRCFSGRSGAGQPHHAVHRQFVHEHRKRAGKRTGDTGLEITAYCGELGSNGRNMAECRSDSGQRNNGRRREDRAAAEENEIKIIEKFLPQQLGDEEANRLIREIVAETDASSMKDMGRVMALVKERLGASIEPARASALVKAALS